LSHPIRLFYVETRPSNGKSVQSDVCRTGVHRLTPSPHIPATIAPIIALDRVGLTLESRAGAVEILKSVSLDIMPGTSVAIVGPSGSGKTSLLMVMAGLERATSGGVRVAGHDFTALSEDGLALARGADIGIVFQSFHLVPTMTAIENVALPLELAYKPDAFARAAELLAEVGLSHRVEHFPAQLSGGEQQRVALARAMAPQPKILFADEPTGNLDGHTGTAVTDLLFGLHAKRQTTLVLVTHDLTLAKRCSRIVRMADGHIVDAEVTQLRRAEAAAQ
jgi:putative ABC transport system ATP-binding protein